MEYVSLLIRWQKTVNLVGSGTLEDVWRRHIMDSAQIYQLLEKPGYLFDLGSGGGFPGAVLSIMGYPNVKLIESNERKCSFLECLTNDLGLGAEVINCRVEDYRPDSRARYITARALAPLDKLLGHSTRLLSREGSCLFLKGKTVEAELTKAENNWIMDIERHSSVSDPQGTILSIRGITPIHGERKNSEL